MLHTRPGVEVCEYPATHTAAETGEDHHDLRVAGTERSAARRTDDVRILDKVMDPDENADAVESPAPRAGRLRRVLVGLVAVVAVSALGALGWTLYQQSELRRLQDQAIATTHDYLVAMAAFDYQNLHANKQTITEQSTTDFAQKWPRFATSS